DHRRRLRDETDPKKTWAGTRPESQPQCPVLEIRVGAWQAVLSGGLARDSNSFTNYSLHRNAIAIEWITMFRFLLPLALLASTLSAQSTISVTRHADRGPEDPDPPLPALGFQQAEALGRLLAPAKTSHISPPDPTPPQQPAAPAAKAAHVA